MNEERMRLIEPGKQPTPRQLALWMGSNNYALWKRITLFIEKAYPGVFKPEWLFGGKKYGWGLRYKKGKSFCTLIPEKNRFAIQIVFGAEERSKVEAMQKEISSPARQEYDKAKTYHDGKWLFLAVDNDEVVADVKQLLGAKRKPKQK
jgi:hypothetical protein